MPILVKDVLPAGERPAAPPAPPRQAERPQRRERRFTALRRAAPALAGYAGIRAVSLLLFAAWGVWQGAPVWRRMGTLWDAAAYLDVARHGYQHAMPPPDAQGHRFSNLAYFPLYPLAIKGVHAALPMSWPSAALLVSWAGAALAAWGIFAVAAHLYGRHVGAATVLLWAALPYAVVANLAYTEAVFTALTAWTLYAVLRERWLWAGVLSSAACLTRPTGIAVAAAVVAAAAAELRRLHRDRAEPRIRERTPWWRPALAAATAPLGWFAFVAWVGHRLGRWDGYFAVQMEWNSRFDFGATTAYQVVQVLRNPLSCGASQAAVSAVLLAAVVLFARCHAQRQPVALLVFSGATLLITLGDAGAFCSRARFLLPVFPLLFPPATRLAHCRSHLAKRLVIGAATAVSAAFGLYLVCISTVSL